MLGDFLFEKVEIIHLEKAIIIEGKQKTVDKILNIS